MLTSPSLICHFSLCFNYFSPHFLLPFPLLSASFSFPPFFLFSAFFIPFFFQCPFHSLSLSFSFPLFCLSLSGGHFLTQNPDIFPPLGRSGYYMHNTPVNVSSPKSLFCPTKSSDVTVQECPVHSHSHYVTHLSLHINTKKDI